MIPINLSGFTANAASPKYDPSYPLGDRITPIKVAGANFSDGLTTPPAESSGVSWWQYPTNSDMAVVNGALRMFFRFNNPSDDSNDSKMLGCDISSLNTNEIFIEFDAKMPNSKAGFKFVKIFGKNPGGNYSNTTFGLDYNNEDNGGMLCTSFGDGTDITNDTQNILRFDGSYPNAVGRSGPTGSNVANVLLPAHQFFSSSMWGTDFHHFRLHVKYNSGTSAQNEVADGKYYVEIDGVVYVNATNIFNRHWSNDTIEVIRFGDYAQWGGTKPPDWDVHYDNIVVSRNGFMP